ncbi:PilZ domain-containing protein [Vibrio sinensis]|uniref:PilZ domain-containing protein n=1 Tax=Vibrio sinensis TaxID=2302434 RepID=A0A3A6RBA5_9VIBR|nr:PilZ domain-containing protein [Vibrio sinensis]RJX74372.1 PilZ domain-containing protein [Vibrio sinensis]
MQQPEILSIVERLIPAYQADDFNYLLSQMTEGEPPSVKILVKIELNRVMASCTKSIDLRGRVQGECREYQLDGLKHWLDDVAFNAYHKNTQKFGSYTEGVWEALCNTRNNFRVMSQNNKASLNHVPATSTEFDVEPITMGYDLKRRENRLRVISQIEIQLANDQLVHAVTVDISPSGAKFKVPTAFDYKLGEIVQVSFIELSQNCPIAELAQPFSYRIVGIDESHENDAVRFLRLLCLNHSTVIEEVITYCLESEIKKTRHDNQDKVIRTRTRGYEHAYLKHTCNLPIFFSGNELKMVLVTDNNLPIWQYWHDERNQPMLSNLFNKERMSMLTAPGMRGCSNVLYSFKHEHQGRELFFSMMMPEADRELRHLFWHVGARKKSWKAFRLSIFELSDEEKELLAEQRNDIDVETDRLTHCGFLQEIADLSASKDYLLCEKPRIATSELNPFRHALKASSTPACVYFDAQSRRNEPRFIFKSPIEVILSDQVITGKTIDISKRGVSIQLDKPLSIRAGELCHLNFKELQLYDKSIPLSKIPYQVVRVSSDNTQIQLMMDGNSQLLKTVTFFGRLIEHNKEKLNQKHELLPSNGILESLHNILLDKMVSTPLFIEKRGANLRPKVIGVNYPLLPHLMLLAKLGQEKSFSMDPIYKGRTNTLLATPMKRIVGSAPQYHELYISAAKFGTRIQSLETKLSSEFESTKLRLLFIKKAQMMGEFYALRICGTPVFDPVTALLRKDLDELLEISLYQARSIEKEITSICGYGEITDITEEVLIRLELTQ